MSDDTQTESKNQVYEIGFLIVPTVDAEHVPAEVTLIKDTLTAEKALVISEEFPKLRPLAYQMRKAVHGKYQKFDRAYFGWVKFESTPEGMLNIKSALEKQESILRFLLIKTVRESTLVPPKTFSSRPEGEGREAKIPTHDASAVKTVVSEAELDKTIAELVAE